MSNNQEKNLTFVPFATLIDPTFWNNLNEKKINYWKLNNGPHSLFGTYSSCTKVPTGSALNLSHNAFDTNFLQENEFEKYFNRFFMFGEILLTNTYKEFVEFDFKNFLNNCGKLMWEVVLSKKWLMKPNLLNLFFLVAYADIKKYNYFFWNCYPAFLFPYQLTEKNFVFETFVTENLYNISINFLKNLSTEEIKYTNAFLILNEKNAVSLLELENINDSKTVTLVFLNPSCLSKKVGWTLRNLITAIAYLKSKWSQLNILALRRTLTETFLFCLNWQLNHLNVNEIPKPVGWERDFNTGELKHRQIHLKFMFDPLQIMEKSADLNLKLIRWRQAPTINLDIFFNLRALIIGAGTLGCNIARILLGWGIRNFTFIDYADISYNNPIRQSLFTFEDCQQNEGSYNKALAAANSLKRIFPCINAKGVSMKIPMPGYPYSNKEKEKVRQTCKDLDKIIEDNDVVFLVMDSRESRWLPTLIASCKNKLTMTVALGFDSYVVIRHGASSLKAPINISGNNEKNYDSNLTSFKTNALINGKNLGCYFCSDVTAPGNSVNDRTLDQQCTISRPGLSMIAAGVAVELMASILQHDDDQGAPALIADVDENSSLLGGTPHQIRGFLSRFHIMTPTVCRFHKCTACGDEVKNQYLNENNFDLFLHKVFQNSGELEKITGLKDLQDSVNDIQLDMLEIEEEEF